MGAQSTVRANELSSSFFLDQVALHILSCHQQDLPDLRGAIVLLPNCHVAGPLAQALSGAAKLPALLLPQMTTLFDWSESVSLSSDLIPDTCRTAVLYQALRARRWFADADLWGIACELLGLLDELTQHHVALPQDEQDFLVQLERAYQAKRNAAMQFEARVVHELWYAMNVSGELDAARAYQQRLAQLAREAEKPLYVLQCCDFAAPEARFLVAYAQRAPLKIFDLREMAAQQAGCAAVHAALHESSFNLRDQAAYLRVYFPQAALGLRMRLFGAQGLEQEAQAAEAQVRRWLLAGKRSIAIVAQDRLVARRVRALLERAGVLVQDESGWMMSTLAVSTVLMRWLDALQSDFYYQDLLDLLKSPFIFADQNTNERKRAVYQLEQLVRKHGVASHLDAFLDLAQGDKEVEVALVRLRQAAQALQKTEKEGSRVDSRSARSNTMSLAEWLRALHDSLDILGVVQGLAADVAGVQLLQALQTWQQELSQDGTRFSRTEWRHWLALQLDSHTFRDASIDSPVLLTHLAATRWRSFDAVLLLGADAQHLPGADSGSVWFNDAVRKTLCLATREDHMAQQRDDLLALLVMNDTVLATWQVSKSGEKNLLSPYLEMLRALHELAYGDDLAPEDRGQESKSLTSDFCPLSSVMPAPAVPQSLIPQRISVSGYNSLVACPYQFYARHVLHLNELDEVTEGVEKRDYGEWVHDILHRFHRQFTVLIDHERALLENSLRHISVEVFAPAVERDYLARAWLLRWHQAHPTYLDAQLKSEAEGWRYKNGEVLFELPLSEDLILHGRIDRVDARKGECRVLDYKMMEAARLRNKLKEPGEDVQLACYAQVYEADEAAFISIEKDKVTQVAPLQDLPKLAQDNTGRLLAVFAQLREGAGMPAHGVNEVCAYCEMRGLCRKAEWKVA